jgi:AraC-like DNA-binding protein
MSKWLIVLFAFLTIWFVSHTLQVIMTKLNRSLDGFYTLNALQFFSGAGLIGLLVSPFFFPGILYGLPRVPERDLLSDNQDLKTDQPPSGRIKEAPDFEAEYLTLIQERTDWCMNELKPHLLPDCNLAYVSKLLNIPAHHLAYYFREVKRQSFNDYRNTWRVNHAKSLILEGKHIGNTIEAIGHLSGFSSANTFHASFKKVTGISPGTFAVQAKP